MPSRTETTFDPPIVAAFRWLDGVSFPPDRPLLNVSQAAPAAAPPESLRAFMARIVMEDTAAHLYGPVLGNSDLRAALADRTARIYAGTVTSENVAITAGCNQAFAATMAALCNQGDQVILPVPWYFNHKMWLDMSGVQAVPLETGPDLLPDPDRAAALITDRTRAIVLVTPNNPGGVEYPPPLLAAFRHLARTQGIKLVIDETYRDFHSAANTPHDLFADPDWDDTLIHLYSFSKAYRLTGHRVGAIIAVPGMIAEVEKFQDTVAICAPQIGQRAALEGIRSLDQWLAGERAEILTRRAAIEQGMPKLTAQGWVLAGLGAYFAYLRHPFDMPAHDLCHRLVHEASILALPGSMFRPKGDRAGHCEIRVAFANIDNSQISVLFDRLAALPFPRRTQ